VRSEDDICTILAQLQAAYKELLLRAWRERDVARFNETLDRLEAVIDLEAKLCRTDKPNVTTSLPDNPEPSFTKSFYDISTRDYGQPFAQS